MNPIIVGPMSSGILIGKMMIENYVVKLIYSGHKVENGVSIGLGLGP